jgi:two-component system chemotaxis sensor kinase CheA
MSTTNQNTIEELASTIQLLADAWPNSRDNIALAGAKFEGLMNYFEGDSDQMQKLLNASWEGIKYLYEKDEYFITVKATTMQAINLVRESILSENEIKEEDFEKALNELKSAIKGNSESADNLISDEELEQLNAKKNKKELTNEDKITQLGEIIQFLADVWPNDRGYVANAGAQFEEIFEVLVKDSSQIKRLANLTWEGLKYLYEENEYFTSVKAATMHSVNVFREYIIADGDITVEDFEKAFDDLENALKGGGESADTVIELTDQEIREYTEKQQPGTKEEYSLGQGLLPPETSLDDLASYIMMLDEESITNDQIERLAAFIANSIRNENEALSTTLKEAYTLVEDAYNNKNVEDGWLSIISIKIESATNKEETLELSTEESNTGCTVPSNNDDTISNNNSGYEVANETTTSNDNSEGELSKTFQIPLDIDVSLVGEFITECGELIEAAEVALLELEDKPDDSELVNTVFRAYHTIKGTSAFMGLEPITEFTHFVETVLSMVRDGDLSFDRACADINFESIDIIKKLLSSVEISGPGDELPIPYTYKGMLDVLIDVSENKMKPSDAFKKHKNNSNNTENFTLDESQVDASSVTEDSRIDAPASETINDATKDNVVQAQKSESESSVRVSVNRLDRLIDMVGELVIAHSVVAQDEHIPNDSELQKKVNHATKILRELQDTSLTLRMVPLKATFHKMNRLVRDLSRKAGKPVKFTTFGEDTEIDRNMVDIINEPLVHMLRNSLDHGVETPEQRGKTNKPKVANISLNAYQEGGKVVIKIQDDGRGIDKDIILKKAIEKGLVDPEKKMSDPEIYGLIFLPGFSSAEKVTDLSGRGVGMDVVKKSIEQLQGKVEVTSELGFGTTITIELPFTLAITDGMLIRVGEERFIIPTINIDMTFRANPEDLFTILGESEQVSFRGESVPVIRLHRLFEISGSEEDILKGTMLIIKNNNNRYALLVDEVIGQQQLVGKSIDMITTSKHISGGAILGDGRVGLILDTGALTV